MLGPNPHITQARERLQQLVAEVELTLALFEQAPPDEDDGPPTPAQLEQLAGVVRHREDVIDAAMKALQGRVTGVLNLVRFRYLKEVDLDD